MNPTTIQQTIQDILSQIAPEADLSDVGPNEDLRTALDIDSMDHLNLIMGINDKLGIDIPEDDYGQLTTLQAIYQYIEERI